ncbi:GH32 C-terminal domain-containing protein [Dysgonomonas sp. BGC7]|uniref:GH32 C-terminal domain-containing protein n=1 Tax=Dysgonomonas sp. BGC7 TaxID=1658008 RepID=UPI000680E3B0|nr:GH32 C-terminal domain-containing protein [Dysgonomonas sp. BGC7]MBD8388934.1 GH32 C-terminal domain-containing protein [Dysgonomonas sp. BGC7]
MNKKQIICNAILALVLIGCTTKSDITIEDFESGTFDGWTVEGDAFGATPATGGYQGQQNVEGFSGKFLANSFNGGDDSRGTLISKEFTIERDYINFLIGGGMHEDTYIELVVDGKSVYKSRSVVESETLQWMTWDVRESKGKSAIIRIVDNQRGGWGHILVDQIEQSNTEKSVFMVDHKLVFEADKKYILVPIDDDAPESLITLDVDGAVVGVPMYIRVAQTEKIGYWVPIDIEKYKGKKVTLTFAHAKKTDKHLNDIKQSDTFNFNYNEAYRPSYHHTPQYGWMNDPNGMVYLDGEYHLFYQYNPYGSRWANMHWGHSVSKDLKKWEYLPVALAPDSLGAIFSGSAVIDKNNTAGFGRDAMIAIYTSAGKSQTQSIAYSTDKGRTFTKYEHNPVLSDPNIADFRDPKVFWHDASRQWIMSLATSQTITFYGSANLKEWNKLSEFGKGLGSHEGVWECPDLFPLSYNGQTKWVLFVSINPGGPNGGSATQYFIGSFDGKTFKADDMDYPLWLDYGRDNYAGVTWSNVPAKDGRHLFIGWMNNWDYANSVPPVDFSSANTLIRELKLVHNGKYLVVANPPISETTDMRRDGEKLENKQVEKTYTIEKLLKDNQGTYEIEFTVKPKNENSFEFKLVNIKGENIRFVFDLKKNILSVDRSKSGIIDFSANFAQAMINAPLVTKAAYKIRLFVDKSSTELFVNDGEVVQTNQVFPTEVYNSLTFDVNDGSISVEDINIYNFK